MVEANAAGADMDPAQLCIGVWARVYESMVGGGAPRFFERHWIAAAETEMFEDAWSEEPRARG